MSDEESPPPRPRPPYSLEYLRPPEPRGPHWAVQLISGAIAWWLVIGVTYASLQSSGTLALYLFVILIIALVSAAAVLVERFGWKLFVPGILIGLALTCLVGFGICANDFKHI